MPTNRPNRNRRRSLVALAVAAAIFTGWHAVASAQSRVTSDGAAGSTIGGSKPGTAQPARPKETPSPDFVPSETVSSDTPVSFPTDI